MTSTSTKEKWCVKMCAKYSTVLISNYSSIRNALLKRVTCIWMVDNHRLFWYELLWGDLKIHQICIWMCLIIWTIANSLKFIHSFDGCCCFVFGSFFEAVSLCPYKHTFRYINALMKKKKKTDVEIKLCVGTSARRHL